jgi:hypothetical protein
VIMSSRPTKTKKQPKNPLLPAKENKVSNEKEKRVVVPPAPGPRATTKDIDAYYDKLMELYDDGDITMEDVENAMMDVEVHLHDMIDAEVGYRHHEHPRMEEEDIHVVRPDRDTEMGGRIKRKKRVPLKAKRIRRPKLSTETEKALERLLGFRVRPYW